MGEIQRKKQILDRFHYSQDQVIDKSFNWKQMWRLLQYIKPYAKNLLPLSFMTVIISAAIRLLIPILIGVYTLDRAIIEKDTTLLIQLVSIIAGLYVLSYIVNALRIRWMNQLGQNVIYDLRKHLFTHVQSLSHRFFDQRSAGSILVRIMNDINSLQELFTNGVINLLTDFLLLTATIFILFSINAKLTIAIMVILPIMFFISTNLRKKIRLSWQQVRLIQSKINSHLNESIQGIRVTQTFTQESENNQFFKEMNKDNFETWQQAVRKNAMFGPFVEITNAIGTAILIWYGAVLVMNWRICLLCLLFRNVLGANFQAGSVV
jgi:ATP-binding cassette, subfamily B, multidrug efflux pump